MDLQGGNGTGLGLWISQEIAKKHGSVIRFRSEGIGKGTTFDFSLPVYCRLAGGASQEAALSTESSEVAAGPSCRSLSPFQPPRIVPDQVGQSTHQLTMEALLSSPPVQPDRLLATAGVCRILVVDDSALNVKYLVRHIQLAEAFSAAVTLEVEQTDDGSTAVEMVLQASQSNRPYDFVFMDNIMRVVNGPEAAQQMRRDGFLGLIFGVTGNVMAKDMQAYLSAGADGVLSKPITTAAVRTALGRVREM